ncbi:M23 family metallopeptidase [bacterium]|nr:M23 family metallopeptidase [bacterium]
MRMHSGIDIQAPRGTTVFPAAPGRVVYAKWKRGYGLMVELDHGNGFSTIYAHCSRLLVGEGKIVQTGTSIAQVGSTGVTTGSHLHFEVIHGSKLENPLKFLAK